MKIVIADDKADARYLLESLLVGHGHTTWAATNGQEALDLVRAHAPELIISDILMPVMDGFQFCREIRTDPALREILFVFYTATYTQESDAEFAATIGADDFIRKPAEPDEFMARIHTVVEKATAGELTRNPSEPEENEVLRLYSERLVAKLEKRTMELEREIAERAIAEHEKRALEAHLHQTQKLEAIGTLASGVAHEINNPLTGIINYAELIGSRVKDPKLRDFAAGIQEEGDRIASIVRSLLSFARQDKDEHSTAHIPDIVDASLSLLGALMRKEQISIQLDIEEDLPPVRCRSQQIQQVLVNLLTNARDALNARHPEFDRDKIVRISATSYQQDGNAYLRLTVEDHGIGIPSDRADSIFDPFFTTKPKEKGTGLGLSISYGIIREHGGRLSLDIETPGVTKFHVDLPVEPANTAEPAGFMPARL